jgi:hypothetical protein
MSTQQPNLSIEDVQHILNEIGQVYVDLRKECLTECAKLLETHEVTLAEQNCMKNCTKKLAYANYHFNKLSYQHLDKVKGLKNDIFANRYFQH